MDAVRIVRLTIDDPDRAEQLLGAGAEVSGPVEVVFVNMLPCPAQAALARVMAHGLVLTFAPDPDDEGQPSGLVVPWGQIAYVRLLPAEA